MKISPPSSVADSFASMLEDGNRDFNLQDGSRVAVVGGGPAGSFFSWFLLKMARAVDLAVRAHEALGRTPELTIVRGGTDGSRLKELGLPTPNLSSGQHNIHSPLEWASLDEMMAASEVGIEIVKLWANEK